MSLKLLTYLEMYVYVICYEQRGRRNKNIVSKS